MSSFYGELPFFMLEPDDAVGLLERHRSPALEPADRRFLPGIASELQARLAGLGAPCRSLHGSPRAGNRLPSADGPVLLDFETACVGPIEWGLAALGDDALAFVPDADRERSSRCAVGDVRRAGVASRTPEHCHPRARVPMPGCSEVSQPGLSSCLVGCR